MKRDKINKGIKKSRVIRNEYILYTRLREKKKKKQSAYIAKINERKRKRDRKRQRKESKMPIA